MWVEKFTLLSVALSISVSVYAFRGISFLEDTPGRWNYTTAGLNLVSFSFIQPIHITDTVIAPTNTLLVTPDAISAMNLTSKSMDGSNRDNRFLSGSFAGIKPTYRRLVSLIR